jgi:excinuclease UvrABC ATPase subunit
MIFSKESSRPMDHLVLVAGLSSSGKSSFMQQIASGALPPDIAARLPPQIEHWRSSEGARRKNGLAASKMDFA